MLQNGGQLIVKVLFLVLTVKGVYCFQHKNYRYKISQTKFVICFPIEWLISRFKPRLKKNLYTVPNNVSEIGRDMTMWLLFFITYIDYNYIQGVPKVWHPLRKLVIY